MPDWIVQHWAKWLFGIIGAGITGAVAAIITSCKKKSTKSHFAAVESRIEGVEQQQTALVVALRASMYDRLYYLHRTFMKQGWISVPDFENVTGIYDGYHGLGGNGVGTQLYEELRKLPKFEPM